MEIKNIIVHEARKEETDKIADTFLRDNENEINSHAEDLSHQLSSLFRKTGLNTGQFVRPDNEDDPKPQFLVLLEKYFDGSRFNDFIAFSQAATKQFGRNLTGSSSSKGGYLWFNHYINAKEHFLSVVLLRKKTGISVSSDLTLDEIEQLDLDRLHMAARINLTTWKNDLSSKYIAFRVGRSANDVTDYFSKFIGCEEYTRAKNDTLNLVEATRKYCDIHSFNEQRKEDVKHFVFEQCTGWLDDDIPVTLENLSMALDTRFHPDKTGQLLEIAQGEPFFLNNEIPIEKSSLKRLIRYSGKSSKLSISFDSEILNVSVFFSDEKNELTITDVPENLARQLSKKV